MKANRVRNSFLLLALAFLFLLPAGGNSNAQTPGLQVIGPQVDPNQGKAESLTIAIVSDYGSLGYFDPNKGQDAIDVANMIHSWNPDYILTAGDNNQQQGTEEQIIAAIAPYQQDIDAGIFFPIWGNHDINKETGTANAQKHMKVPDTYTVKLGNGLLEWVNPYGAGYSGDSPAILPDYLSTVNNSEATWVLTGVHQPPYSSGKSGNNLGKHWVIQDGVDLIVSGHDHHIEHIIDANGQNFVITGNGGDGTTNLYTPTTGSQYRDNRHMGAMRLTITQETLQAEFVAVGGEVIYFFTLGHDADGNTVVLNQSDTETDPTNFTFMLMTLP